MLFFWSILDLCLLCGDFPLAHHWGYWQDWLGIFNEDNPSGDFVESELNLRILLIVLGFSVVVAIKRFWIGFYQGRKLFVYYAKDLAKIMKKLLLVSQVAALAVQLEREREMVDEQCEVPKTKVPRTGIDIVVDAQDENSDVEEFSVGASDAKSTTKLIQDEQDEEEGEGLLSYAQKQRIDRILGNWTEPDAAPLNAHVRSVESA